MNNKAWDISKKPTKSRSSSPSLASLFLVILRKSSTFALGFLVLTVLASSTLTFVSSRDQVTNSAKASVEEMESAGQKLLLEKFDPKTASSKLQEIDSELLKLQEIITATGLSGSMYAEFGLVGREISYPQTLIRITANLRKLITVFEELEEFQDLNRAQIKDTLQESLSLARKIVKSFDQIKDSSAFASYDLQSYQAKLAGYEKELFKILELSSFIPEILGYSGNKRYLLLFQNNREARPTGGFIGTFGLVEARDGRFNKPSVQDSYYLNFLKRAVFKEDIEEEKDSFPEELKPSPEIRQYNFHWSSLMDGNWIADFARSAKKIEWSFSNVYHQGSVDGVVALDPNIIEELLRVTGPIELPDYNVTLSAENFRDTVEYKVEVDNPFKKGGDKTANPKQILSDFTDIFYYKLLQLSTAEYRKVALKIFLGIYEKHILFYFNNPRLQQIAEELNIAGRVAESPYDYLHINRTNISATKSSRRVKDRLTYKVKIEPDYTVSADLIVARQHLGMKGVFDSRDKTLLQVYTPKGTTLQKVLGAQGDLSKTINFSTLGKTVFAVEVDLLPKESQELTFSYQLPSPLKADYRGKTTYELLVQKQPGIDFEDFTLEIEWPQSWSIKEALWLKTTGKNSGIIKKKLYSDTKFSFDFQT